jgi:hypothetical protein
MKSLRELISEASSKSTTLEYGFDLTDFKPGGFQRFLKRVDISPKITPSRGKNGEFIWTNDGLGLTIVTGNNPITGEYSIKGRRDPEVDFASYIGISVEKLDDPDTVDPKEIMDYVVNALKSNTSYIKGEDKKKRSYI